jgi:CheY-like chemotaxis protein
MHGGTVRVASEGVGKGAAFTVTIPQAIGVVEGSARKPVSERMPGTYGTPGGLGIRVLVVEDDVETRDIVAAILERSGFSYRVATRASEALSVLDDWLPDAIVSDIGMPDVDGYELMRQLRTRPAHLGGLIPALALTAYARSADRDLALRAGYQAHVAKPVDPVDLVRAITELTGRPVSPGDTQI